MRTYTPPTPAEIERLLYEGAKYTRRSIEDYRQVISEIAEKHAIRFDQALLIATPANLEQVRKILPELEHLQEEAARLGCSFDQLGKAYERIYESTEAVKTGATESRFPLRRKRH